MEYLRREIRKEFDDKINSLQKENIDIKKENKDIKSKFDEFQKYHENKIRSMKKYHENDINRINNQLLFQKKYTESLINKEKGKYINLNQKYKNEIITSNNLKGENEKKVKK